MRGLRQHDSAGPARCPPLCHDVHRLPAGARAVGRGVGSRAEEPRKSAANWKSDSPERRRVCSSGAADVHDSAPDPTASLRDPSPAGSSWHSAASAAAAAGAEEPPARLAPVEATPARSSERVDPMRPVRLTAEERERLYEQAARDAEPLERQATAVAAACEPAAADGRAHRRHKAAAPAPGRQGHRRGGGLAA